MDNTKLKLEDVVADIARVMDEHGLEADELTVTKYSKLGGKYDGRHLRRLGGFAAIVDHSFRHDKQPDIYTTRAIAKQRQYVTKLERQVADSHDAAKNFEEALKRAMKEMEGCFVVSEKPKFKTPHAPDKIARENGVLISDIHLGLKIDREEVQSNAYNWLIAARRLAKLAVQVASYKSDHRDECSTLRVLLGGDLGQGVIHLDDDGTDLMAYQFTGMAYYLTQMIDYWRHHYKRIVIECTPDNHLRFPHKGPGRQFPQKHDSFATMLHVTLQMAFRNAPDVEFHVPKTPITTFEMLGHKMALTHGDTHVSSGNIGKQINIKSIADQVLRMNSAALDGRRYEAIFLGHVHVPAYTHMPECGADLVVNGTASGTDGYANGIGIHSSSASQVIWETTREHAIGDFRRQDLSDADEDPVYDAIISEYKYGYEINKMLFPCKR